MINHDKASLCSCWTPDTKWAIKDWPWQRFTIRLDIYNYVLNYNCIKVPSCEINHHKILPFFPADSEICIFLYLQLIFEALESFILRKTKPNIIHQIMTSWMCVLFWSGIKKEGSISENYSYLYISPPH